MLTLHPKPGLELLVVEVPEDAKPYILDSCNNKVQALFYTQENNPSPPWFMLPYPGNYSFIATTKTISEEQAAELVEIAEHFSTDGETSEPLYRRGGGALDFEAVSALHCQIEEAGGDPDKHNYAILKKL